MYRLANRKLRKLYPLSNIIENLPSAPFYLKSAQINININKKRKLAKLVWHKHYSEQVIQSGTEMTISSKDHVAGKPACFHTQTCNIKSDMRMLTGLSGASFSVFAIHSSSSMSFWEK